MVVGWAPRWTGQTEGTTFLTVGGLSDLISVTTRLRSLFPDHHLIVDIDDGFGDAGVASHVARTMERCGASAVVLEDQAQG